MSLRKQLAVALALAALAAALLAPAAAQADFGIADFSAAATNEGGSVDTQAGSHPYEYTLDFELNQIAEKPEGTLHSLYVELPPGLVGNPQALPRCKRSEFDTSVEPVCPGNTQIGIADIRLNGLGVAHSPLYSLTPSPGAPASLGLSINNNNSIQNAALRSGSDYGITVFDVSVPTNVEIQGVTVHVWGEPMAASHDALRFCINPLQPETVFQGCPSDAPPAPFLTLPASCSGPMKATLRVDALEAPGVFAEESALSLDEAELPVGLEGCNALEFEPTISSQPTTNLADAPSGLDFNLHQRQEEDPEGLATSPLKEARVALPEGMTLNPAAANGLGACTEAEIGYAPSGGEIHFSEAPQSCPDAAKVGSLEVSSPLLDHGLGGAVYLAEPYANPFGSLVAIYLAVEDPRSGIVAKLAGKVEPDPTSGRLRATFTDNPQLPIEDIDLHFFGGPRGALKTPLACGTYTTTSTLTPWSTPEGADAHPSDSFQTSVPASGSGTCPTSEAGAPNSPAFTAGTATPQAGAYSPFLLKLTRPDGSQQLTAIEATLPPGLTGKLAGVPYCSEAQIAQAKGREAPNLGALERSMPSCPAASEIGSVTVGAGAGIAPLYVQGRAYLAGPYKSAPLSLVIITPAVAGPFDLGAVVVRSALQVDPETTRIHAVSDPLPTIIAGVPLDVRSIALRLDRPGFTLNPTSCDPTAIAGSALTLAGQSAALSSPFQLGGCNSLKFKPKLAISLKGGTRRNRYPALKAVLTYPQGGAYANIASAQVNLPRSEFLEQSHIRTVCTRPQLASRSCPAASVYGRATAYSPLLDKPLSGPVYLGVGFGHALPDLVADLDGQVRVLLHGRVDTGPNRGIRNSFEVVPDAPVSKFVLEMQGGRKGLLVNSENICRRPQRAIARFTAHNGATYSARPLIANSCKKAKKGRKGKGGRGAGGR